MVIIIAALVLAGVTFAFVVYPLFREEAEERETAGDRRLEALAVKERAARSALEELEYDFASGQLSEEDYRELKEKHEERAAALAGSAYGGEQTERVRPQVREDALEAEILRRRQSQRKAAAVSAGLVCPRCGARAREGDRACTRCGAQLPLRCPKCGASYRRGDRFCARCAAPLPTGRSSR